MIVRAAGAEEAGALATLHAEAFDQPWGEASIRASLSGGGAFALAAGAGPDGFILIRTAAEEAEVLTFAVRPAARRCGLGRALLDAAILRSRDAGARTLFLEVAADNAAALALYRAAGFAEGGRRANYYPRSGHPSIDALILALPLAAT